MFAHAGFSAIKTLVMMLGEIDFGDMFAQHVTKSGIVPTFHMPYPVFTTIYFVVFITLISILLMNLLVGVAIDNVNGVADTASLQRLSMQLKVSLDTEFLWEGLAKKWTIREEVVKPNPPDNALMAIIRDDGTLQRMTKKVVAHDTKVRRKNFA